MLDAPCLVQKTGEQLLTLAKQLVFHGCGIIPTREWYMVPARHQQRTALCPHREALVCWVRWADSLWKRQYTGEQNVSLWGP